MKLKSLNSYFININGFSRAYAFSRHLVHCFNGNWALLDESSFVLRSRHYHFIMYMVYGQMAAIAPIPYGCTLCTISKLMAHYGIIPR